jgi:Protein of unknown function (DUF2934)
MPVGSMGSCPTRTKTNLLSSDPATSCGGRCLLELVRARAYQLFEANGRPEGRALDDWLQAEHEIKQHLGFELTCELKPEPLS